MYPSRKRIMTVEHHSTLSEGLVSLVASQPDMELVATAAGIEEARKRFAETSPDITIVDVDMPKRAGLQIIGDIRRDRPDAAIIALVSYEWDYLALDAVRMGASAFLPKDKITEQLLDLIRASKRD